MDLSTWSELHFTLSASQPLSSHVGLSRICSVGFSKHLLDTYYVSGNEKVGDNSPFPSWAVQEGSSPHSALSSPSCLAPQVAAVPRHLRPQLSFGHTPHTSRVTGRAATPAHTKQVLMPTDSVRDESLCLLVLQGHGTCFNTDF